MELRARTRPSLRRAAMMAALVALAAPAMAGAAPSSAHAAKKKPKAPVVKKVFPLNVAVGEKLTLRGRRYIKGRRKNTVVFKRKGARAVFAKADIATRKMLTVTVPASLQEFFRTTDAGVPQPTRFRLRVLARTFGRKFTKPKRSPLIFGARDEKPAETLPDGDCDGDGVPNSQTDDDDGDLLSDGLESRILSNPCVADTDGDAVEDGYEYRSAIDLNDDEFQQPNGILAYPHKMPYPNPGFADGGVDYDGDTLTLREEFELWVYTYSVTRTDPRSLDALSYSDGEQYTRSARGADGRRKPTLSSAGYDKHLQFVDWATRAGYRTVILARPGPWWYAESVLAPYGLFDMNRLAGETADERDYFDLRDDSFLSDDERDEDADGLTNYDETHGRTTAAYWAEYYPGEKPFHIGYGGTSHVDADSDGDGVLDGADDQDHDDVPNVMELSRIAASGIDDREPGTLATPRTDPPLDPENNHADTFGRVNPFNPCLPNKFSRTCPKIVNKDTGAPFDGSPNWYSLN